MHVGTHACSNIVPPRLRLPCPAPFFILPRRPASPMPTVSQSCVMRSSHVAARLPQRMQRAVDSLQSPSEPNESFDRQHPAILKPRCCMPVCS